MIQSITTYEKFQMYQKILANGRWDIHTSQAAAPSYYDLLISLKSENFQGKVGDEWWSGKDGPRAWTLLLIDGILSSLVLKFDIYCSN